MQTLIIATKLVGKLSPDPDSNDEELEHAICPNDDRYGHKLDLTSMVNSLTLKVLHTCKHMQTKYSCGVTSSTEILKVTFTKTGSWRSCD